MQQLPPFPDDQPDSEPVQPNHPGQDPAQPSEPGQPTHAPAEEPPAQAPIDVPSPISPGPEAPTTPISPIA